MISGNLLVNSDFVAFSHFHVYMDLVMHCLVLRAPLNPEKKILVIT